MYPLGYFTTLKTQVYSGYIGIKPDVWLQTSQYTCSYPKQGYKDNELMRNHIIILLD